VSFSGVIINTWGHGRKLNCAVKCVLSGTFWQPWNGGARWGITITHIFILLLLIYALGVFFLHHHGV